MEKTQWLWMQASVALVRNAATALRRDAAALSALPHRRPLFPPAPWEADKP